MREGCRGIKEGFKVLLQGEGLKTPLNEQSTYYRLEDSDKAVWSLLVASGYLKVLSVGEYNEAKGWQESDYGLALTNLEVESMFRNMEHLGGAYL